MKLSLSKKSISGNSGSKECSSIALHLQNRAKPPGITNLVNNCYASSIFQCMFNHPELMKCLRQVIKNHNQRDCSNCQQNGTMILDHNN